MKKILIVSTFAYTLVNFRGDMMAEMLNLGHEVLAAAPESEEQWAEKFEQMGIRYISVPLVRTGLTPLKDIRAFIFLYKLMKKEKPHIVFTYQAKSITYGCIAAKAAGVPRIYSLIAGLGSVFQPNGFKGIIIKAILSIQYKVALSVCRKVFFQNSDDINDFIKMGLVKGDKTVTINGSGVNLERFVPKPMPNDSVFLFVGRLLHDKGLIEFIEAACLVKKQFPTARFVIVGPLETNPTAVKPEELEQYIQEGIIEYPGATYDVKPFLWECTVFVLPSYREGTSRAVLEAMATGRPIITTDSPGCRETVRNGVNGFLVPVKDIKALAERMIWMIENPEEASRMGRESIRICREKYDVRKVNRDILRALELI